MSGITPLAGTGMAADPRENRASVDASTGYANRTLKNLHDPKVTFEEYLYYAKITREDEKRLYGPGSNYKESSGPVAAFFKSKIAHKQVVERKPSVARTSFSEPKDTTNGHTNGYTNGDEKLGHTNGAQSPERWEITDDEWVTASRAARTAAWGACFYLITTDILGPFSTGWAFAQMGWGPSLSLYTVFGFLSAYSGYQLWRIFLQMDSDRYPMKDYGDVAFRVFGQWARHVTNVLQSFQFFFNVGLIVISSGQGISQMSKGNLCFIVCVLVCAIAGCLIGQIRTLARFGWLASLAVFCNLFVIFFSMGIMAHSPPNYITAQAQDPALIPDINNPPPIQTAASFPPGTDFKTQVVGLMQAVFSFGGATLFVNLLAELRRPWDFWKALLLGELFIYSVYMIYGAYVYHFQGQYANILAYQGISPYTWQTVGNALELITGLLAACLYGNIGIKVLYNNIGRDLLHFPVLESKVGKWIWVAFVPTYWLLAFIVAAAIPQVALFSGFVAAACILQFTYTFPPLLMVGFKCQRDAILPGETFDPNTGRVQRLDSGVKRWWRGYRKEFIWNTWDVIYFLGAVVTAVLGLYTTIYGMHQAYSTNPNIVAFSCVSPVNG